MEQVTLQERQVVPTQQAPGRVPSVRQLLRALQQTLGLLIGWILHSSSEVGEEGEDLQVNTTICLLTTLLHWMYRSELLYRCTCTGIGNRIHLCTSYEKR